MSMKSIQAGVGAFALGAVMLTAAGVAQKAPDATPDTVVEKRQDLMKRISQNQKAIGAAIAGNNLETDETLAGHAATIKSLAGRIPTAFAAEPGAPGADKDAKTRAMPVPWSKWPTYVANANLLERRAAAVQAAADAGDRDTMEAAYASMTKTCVACHDQFRAKKK